MTRERELGLSRRRYLEAAGVGVVSLVGVGTAQAAGGDELWRFETGYHVQSSPTVVDGTVFVGSGDSNVYALAAGDGTEQWRFETGYIVYSSPTVVDGTVFVGSWDNNVYALDAGDGTEQWRFDTGDIVDSSPTVVDGTVFVGSGDNNVYALDAGDGTEQWRFDTGGFVESSPTVVNGTVFVGSRDNNVYALDAGDGTEQWRFDTGRRVRSSPTATVGNVFVGSDDGNVYALHAGNGHEDWRFEIAPAGDVRSSPTVVDGTVFVGSNDTSVYALDAADGTEQWRFETGHDVRSSPTVVGGIVFVGSYDNKVYGLSAYGNEYWRFETGDHVHSSPTVVDGTVFIGSWDNNVYALDAGVSGSSEGSRVMLGTLGHHGDWRYAGQTINDPPTAAITVTPTAPQTGESVTFEASGSSDPDGSISSYEWSIDGATYSGITVEYTFEDTGEYTVEVTVTDDDGATATARTEFSVAPPETTTNIPTANTTEKPQKVNTDTPTETTNEKPPQTTTDTPTEKPPQTTTDTTTATPKKTTTSGAASEGDSDQSIPWVPIGAGALASLAGVAAWRRRSNDGEDSDTSPADSTPDGPDTPDPETTTDYQETLEPRSRAESMGIDRTKTQMTEADSSPKPPTKEPHWSIPPVPALSLSYDQFDERDPIGQGGNADVYRVTVETSDGSVDIAVKEPRMQGTLHTETVERLLKEAETWDKLDDHDHIVELLDYGSEPVPWLAMEYMNSGNLGDCGPGMEFDQALWTAVAITNALNHAHHRGVAHLDLKPENVLFRSIENGWDVPKVADWGLSKHLLNHSKSIDGYSPQYAAPEQFDESYGDPDHVTDIYQLGAVFYELFTGETVFEGQTGRVIASVLSEEPTPPSEVAAVPERLDQILLRALAKEKADRYETVVNLRNDLQALGDRA